MIDKNSIATKFKAIQASICKELEKLDGKSEFTIENWQREGGGGGITRVIENGNLLEKGGVNFSAVEGVLPPSLMLALKVNRSDFFATGVSIVLHPFHPLHPIIHMNIRYFELGDGTYWFGGGIDLTPIYVDNQESSFFHNQLKTICDSYDLNYYQEFKNWADNYFFIKHRNETRGIGGIFFDKLSGESRNKSKEDIFNFVCSVGESFAPTYSSIIYTKGNPNFSNNQKLWQFQRRGRYVEFNLVYDKGTKFGLETDGRIESILMSLPPQANWIYNYQVKENSAEKETLNHLKKGINWI